MERWEINYENFGVFSTTNDTLINGKSLGLVVQRQEMKDKESFLQICLASAISSVVSSRMTGIRVKRGLYVIIISEGKVKETLMCRTMISVGHNSPFQT